MNQQHDNCDICIKNNLRNVIPKSSNFRSTHPMELLHVDLIDRISKGIHQMQHSLTIVDDFSKCQWSIPLQNKFQTYSKFKESYIKHRDNR
jgi:hypothetical protein